MIINGWTIYFHPLFADQLARVVAATERDRTKIPVHYRTGPNAKLLKAIWTVTLDRIPRDPADRRYRLGAALGERTKHWFRDKFGNGRFRLFFRFDSRSKIILYIWMNDETTLRTYGSKSDAYAVFGSMLNDGNPPDDWKRLLAECAAPDAIEKAAGLLKKATDA